MSQIRRRLASQRGQTAAEWMGVLLLVAAITAVLVSSPIGKQLTDNIRATICKIAGGSCEPEDGNYATGVPPLNECVRESSKRGLEGAVKITVVKIGGEINGIIEERADGTVRVTFEGNAKLGLDFGPPSVEGSAGDKEAGAGADVEVNAKGGGQFQWDFENRDAANDFIGDVEKKALAILDPLPNAPWTDDDADIDLPDPTRKTYQGGIEVSASGKRGTTGLDGSIGGSGGVTYDEKSGEKTVFVELKGGGSASVEGGPFGGGFDGSGRLAITYDKNGEEKAVRFIGTVDATSNIKLSPDTLKQQGLDGAVKEATKFKPQAGEKGGARVIFDANLALGDEHPENQAAWDAFKNGINPLEGGGTPVAAGTAAAGLLSRFNDDAVMNTKVYSLEKGKYGGELDLGVGGVEGYYNTEDAKLLDAFYRDKTGEGWTRWEECVQGQAS